MTYSEFVQFLFDRPDELKDWYYDENFVPPELDLRTQVSFAREVFRGAESYAKAFTERQFCLAHNYLVNPACSAHCYSYLDASVDEAERLSVFTAMFSVFSLVFDKKCVEVVSHRTDLGPATYGYLCYMWWDVFPRHGIPRSRDLEETDLAILNALKEILSLRSLACKESALHGLGHWCVARPDFVETTVDNEWLQIPVSLREYAKSARAGSVQ